MVHYGESEHQQTDSSSKIWRQGYRSWENTTEGVQFTRLDSNSENPKVMPQHVCTCVVVVVEHNSCNCSCTCTTGGLFVCLNYLLCWHQTWAWIVIRLLENEINQPDPALRLRMWPDHALSLHCLPATPYMCDVVCTQWFYQNWLEYFFFCLW